MEVLLHLWEVFRMIQVEFLESIREGKWFKVLGDRKQVFAVKMKDITLLSGKSFIQTIWLSNDDSEAMCFSDYSPSDWVWSGDKFVHQSCGVYQFGETTPSKDSIYEEETGEIDEIKLKKAIFDYAEENFIDEAEFDQVWSKLKSRESLGFEVLAYS
jgi:hypothetical protein